jgi:hypothetical protein
MTRIAMAWCLARAQVAHGKMERRVQRRAMVQRRHALEKAYVVIPVIMVIQTMVQDVARMLRMERLKLTAKRRAISNAIMVIINLVRNVFRINAQAPTPNVQIPGQPVRNRPAVITNGELQKHVKTTIRATAH